MPNGVNSNSRKDYSDAVAVLEAAVSAPSTSAAPTFSMPTANSLSSMPKFSQLSKYSSTLVYFSLSTFNRVSSHLDNLGMSVEFTIPEEK